MAVVVSQTPDPVHPTPSEGDMAKVNLVRKPSASMLPHPTWLSSLEHVHPMIKGIFPITEVSSPLAGRIQRFLVNWKLLTTDKNILNTTITDKYGADHDEYRYSGMLWLSQHNFDKLF